MEDPVHVVFVRFASDTGTRLVVLDVLGAIQERQDRITLLMEAVCSRLPYFNGSELAGPLDYGAVDCNIESSIFDNSRRTELRCTDSWISRLFSPPLQILLPPWVASTVSHSSKFGLIPFFSKDVTQRLDCDMLGLFHECGPAGCFNCIKLGSIPR